MARHCPCWCVAAQDKGLAVSNSDPIRSAHNSFARAEPFMVEESKAASDKDEAYHFIAYVPFGNRVYELDGLKPGPILLGEGEDWLSVARPAIEARMARYSASEIRFSLMGVIKDRRETLNEQLAAAEQQRGAIERAQAGGAAAAAPLPADFVLASDEAGLAAQLAEVTTRISNMREELRGEEEKRERWRVENIRRRHNYIPFVVNLFRILAEVSLHQSRLLPRLTSRRCASTGSNPPSVLLHLHDFSFVCSKSKSTENEFDRSQSLLLLLLWLLPLPLTTSHPFTMRSRLLALSHDEP